MHRWKLAGVSEAIRTQRTLAVLAHRRHHRLHAAQRERQKKGGGASLPPDDLPQADAVARRCGRTPCTQWHLALLCMRARLALAAHERRGRLLPRPPAAHEPCTHIASRS